jgi:hypothetical protein
VGCFVVSSDVRTDLRLVKESVQGGVSFPEPLRPRRELLLIIAE